MSRRRELLLFAAIVAVVAATRAPFLPMILAGEEGEFGRSVVMVAQGKLPRGIIARSSRGHEMDIPAGHNVGGYLLVGAPFTPVLRWTRFSTIEQRTRAAVGLRACFALLYALALVLALALVDRARRGRAALLLGAFSVPALPLLGSVQVNYDGSISTLVVVGALWLHRRAAQGRAAWAVAAGAFLSFGKLEFAAATAAAIVVADVAARRWRRALLFAGALGLGLVGWRLLDPSNFTYGSGLITRYWAMSNGNQASLVARARTYAAHHVALFWPLYLALALGLVGAVLSRRRLVEHAPVGLTLLFIVVGYHAIAWRGDDFPRYLAPCFPLAAVLLAELELPAAIPLSTAALLLALAAPRYVELWRDRAHALGHLVHTERDDHALAVRLEAIPRDCITVTDMDAGVGFYSSRAAFACCFAQWTEFAAQQSEPLCR